MLHVQEVQASPGDTVRVGYYPLDNYHAPDEDGNVTGYEAEYLNRISEITGWTFEYVKQKSWGEAMDALQDGRIDLLSPAQLTPEREAKFDFSSMPLGKTYGAIMTLSTNDYIYEDFDAFADMTLGIEKDSIHSVTFEEYAKANDFTPHIVYYKDFPSMVEALNVGEIDALADNIMRTQKNMKLLGKFGTSMYYFMMRKGDSKRLYELDQAMYQIDVDTPTFEQELVTKYFPIYDLESLTKEEIEYAQNMRELVVGLPVNTDPVSYLDEETKEIGGITREILDRVAVNAGLKFKYVALPDGQITYRELQELGIDLIACVEYNSVNAKSKGVHLSSPYFQAKKVIVCERGSKFDPDKEMTLAIVSGSQTLAAVIQNTYPAFKIVTYTTASECLDAVKKGEADGMMYNQYSVERLLQKPEYEELSALAAVGIGDAHCLSPVLLKNGTGELDEELSNPLLMNVINKGINNISEEEMSQILINQATKRRYQFTLGDFFYRYKYMVLAIAAALLAIGCAVAYSMRMKKKTLEVVKSSEEKLENITNNINGGVLILQPDQELRLLYANEGFWSLLQYAKEEIPEDIGNNYIMYVHEEDKKALHEVLQEQEKAAQKRLTEEQKKAAQSLTPGVMDKGTVGSVSLRLRVRRRDGSYIPALFNGTLASDEDGMIKLYCVIMDISQEVAIQEKLKLEEQKHHLLIDKTEQIVYELELAKREIKTSEAFYKKFGWILARSYKVLDKAEILSIWRVHPDDQSAFAEGFCQALDEMKDTNVTVRLMKADGKAVWCNISQFIMLDSKGKPKELLGLIRDVNEEMKEKRKLAEKSQRDALTGLYNKEAFRQYSREYLKNAKDEDCAVIFLDLDNFKNINDSLGHLQGDEAIKAAADTLKEVFSGQDIVARFGGDEFCVLVKNVTLEGLTRKVRWLGKELNCSYGTGDMEVQVTASIGVTTASVSGYELSILLEHADTALYESKEAGRNQYTFYSE